MFYQMFDVDPNFIKHDQTTLIKCLNVKMAGHQIMFDRALITKHFPFGQGLT